MSAQFSLSVKVYLLEPVWASYRLCILSLNHVTWIKVLHKTNLRLYKGYNREIGRTSTHLIENEINVNNVKYTRVSSRRLEEDGRDMATNLWITWIGKVLRCWVRQVGCCSSHGSLPLGPAGTIALSDYKIDTKCFVPMKRALDKHRPQIASQ